MHTDHRLIWVMMYLYLTAFAAPVAAFALQVRFGVGLLLSFALVCLPPLCVEWAYRYKSAHEKDGPRPYEWLDRIRGWHFIVCLVASGMGLLLLLGRMFGIT